IFTMSCINGKYQLDSHDNFEKYLSALGVPADKAAEMGKAKTVVEITQEGKQMTMFYPANSQRPEVKNVLTLGQETELTSAMGKHTVNLNQDGNTFKGVIKAAGKTMTSSFTFSESGFIDMITLGDVTATRRYKRI
ncbi:unnamed protein product, partial [Meganyctiphanes norvegica]